MPPKPPLPLPRSIHLPAHSPAPLPNPIASSSRLWKPAKPHLASFHLESSTPTASQPPFLPPVAPQIPPRRQPVFSPQGFGLQFQPTQKGKEKVIEQIAAEENKEEAEACYVVSTCVGLWSQSERQPPPATLHHYATTPLPLLYSSQPLPPFQIAYETWGTLNADRSNAILLHTGLSASSHVASNGNGVAASTSSKPGWWEAFVGPGKSIDTDKFFVICTNVLGGCFGSTGPSSPYPLGEGNVRWATRFPLLSIHDMTRGQLSLLDDLGINKLYASVGASMGGMQSLSLAYLAPDRVGRVASISATGRSGLGGVGMRYAQRSGASSLSPDNPR